MDRSARAKDCFSNATQEMVLAIQDTSELDCSEHQTGTRRLGLISNLKARGMKLYTVLALSDEGVPLDVLH